MFYEDYIYIKHGYSIYPHKPASRLLNSARISALHFSPCENLWNHNRNLILQKILPKTISWPSKKQLIINFSWLYMTLYNYSVSWYWVNLFSWFGSAFSEFSHCHTPLKHVLVKQILKLKNTLKYWGIDWNIFLFQFAIHDFKENLANHVIQTGISSSLKKRIEK